MIRATEHLSQGSSEREAVRRRVKQMYAYFNRDQWDKCYSLLDPKLTGNAKVDERVYADSLQRFKAAYGAISPWYIRINLHLDARANKRDPRPFAYVYVVWQDESRGFHIFRERWVKDGGRWFTRVAGLVMNQDESATGRA